MRVLLVALNAKYVHTNLALRYLREGCRAAYSDVLLREYSINEPLERIAAEIYEAKADVIGFSCYIWNMKETMALIRQLHPVCPQVHFVLGGPEVSYNVEDLLREVPEVDAIVVGEGEEPFIELLQTWEKGQDLSAIAGLAWVKDGEPIVNPPRDLLPDLNHLPQPYFEEEDFTGRLVYVETTRGCPFNCQYCLSSTFQGVRFLDPERFRAMFRLLLAKGARTVKFVDRTFNAYKQHAFRILDIVREESQNHPEAEKIRVHCEMAGDLLDESWMDYLRDYPVGLIQLEIGVQSTHQPTLEIISRPQKFDAWKKAVPILKAWGIPIHLDLIAGLPEENWASFRTSFNDVYAVEPSMLQLGFLKVLKGSGLRQQSKKYGLVFSPNPPYTILQTRVMPREEIIQLQRMEDLLDKYYNSGKFVHALQEILKHFATPFDFYDGFAAFWQEKGWFQRQWHGKALFEKLWEFLEVLRERMGNGMMDSVWENVRDALRFDYYLWERPHGIPEFLQPVAEVQGEDIHPSWEIIQEELRVKGYWEDVIPELQAMDRRQRARNTALAYFTTDVLKTEENTKAPCWYLFFYQQGTVSAYRYDG